MRGYVIAMTVPDGRLGDPDAAHTEYVDTVYPTSVSAIANALLRLDEAGAVHADIDEIDVLLRFAKDSGEALYMRTVAEVQREGDSAWRVVEV